MLYTAGLNVTTILRDLEVYNTASVEVDVQVYIGGPGPAAAYVGFPLKVPAQSGIHWDGRVIIQPSSELASYVSAAGVTLLAMGYVLT